MTAQQSATLARFARMGYERIAHTRSARTGIVYLYLKCKLQLATLYIKVLTDGSYTGNVIRSR